jgi:glycosyltransferase involved in cell wall biosynthesis
MTDTEPAVSVIVPCYRVTEYIREALDSLRAQTFRNFETIVINDGCPDTANLERALEPYRGEIVYIKQENTGLSGARNSGIKAARAP